MLYMINHGAVSYGANTILTNINFEINAGQKIAVVGRNGCGKTTLLKLIEGEVALEKRDSDEDIYIAKSGNPVIGYLKQIAFADETISMETEVRKVFEPYREKQRELEAQRQIMESDPSELNIRIYTQMQELLKGYDRLLMEYRTYSMEWATDGSEDNGTLVDRQKALDLLEQEMLSRGRLVSLQVSGNKMVVAMSGMSLDQISRMFDVIQQSPIVSNVELNLASTEDGNVSTILDFTVRITLRSAEEADK